MIAVRLCASCELVNMLVLIRIAVELVIALGFRCCIVSMSFTNLINYFKYFLHSKSSVYSAKQKKLRTNNHDETTPISGREPFLEC